MPLNDNAKSLALDLSPEVIGAAIEVDRWLGPGLLESVYEAALCSELTLRKIQVTRQKRLPISYKGQSLNCNLRLDLLVEGILIVEVKSLESILPIHKAQLLTYLRLHDLRVGLLINFNVVLLRHGVRRVLNGITLL
jgi:GxxExxY protein